MRHDGGSHKAISMISKRRIQYYYDGHPTEEELRGYSKLQADMVMYLITLLGWMFRAERWHIALKLNIYTTADPYEVPTIPDIAVYKGVVLDERQEYYLESWRVDPPLSPPPAIVFEVVSGISWISDLEEKPEVYARMGVNEYVYFDPRPSRPQRSPGLRVWRTVEGSAVELPADESGRVWSEELQSWLVPEGRWLRLYERNEQMRLTGEEAERAAKEAMRAARVRVPAPRRKPGVGPGSLPSVEG